MKRSTWVLLCLATMGLLAPVAVAEEGNALVNAIDSPVKTEGSYDAVAFVVNSTPHVGSAPFGITIDTTDDSVWVADLFSGSIHQYAADLTFLQTLSPPAMAGNTTSGFAYDAANDTFWLYIATTGTFTEVDKTGASTGNTLFFAPGGLVGPATIDPDSNPGTVWCEDIGLDAVFQLDLTTGSVLNTHGNPDNTGAGAFGNGLGHDVNDSFANPGNMIISSGTLGEGAVVRLSAGQPNAPGLPRAYAEIFDVAAISTFINGLASAPDDQVYLVDNAGNAIVLIGEEPAILQCAPGSVNLGLPGSDLIDDMDPSAEANWAVSGSGFGTPWAVLSSGFARSAPNVWNVLDEATLADKYLDLTIDINAPDTGLEFYHTFSMESGFDGGVLEISTDGGSTFNDLGADILEGGYNGTIDTRFGNPLSGRDAWTGGTLGTMTRVAVDLSAYAGSGRVVRWRHGSDDSVAALEWDVDDVASFDPNNPCTGGPLANTLFLNRVVPTSTEIDDLEPTADANWAVNGTGFAQNWTVISSGNAESPVNVWFASNEGTLTDKYLDLTVDIPASGETNLEFYHTFQLENNFDGGVLEISTDGGTVFNDLGAQIVEGGYNGGPISACCGNPIQGQLAWTGGAIGAMTRVLVDLAPQAGTVGAIIRWRLATDASVSSVGWEVDSLSFVATGENEGTGGDDFTETLGQSDPIDFRLDEAPGNQGDAAGSDACMYIWLGEPESADVVALPANTGTMCFGYFSIATKNPKKIFNGIGRPSDLGQSSGGGFIPGIPEGGNFQFARRNGGAGQAITATVQGIIEDKCSAGNKPYSVTNGILVIVE